jgi:hypothetical protein
MGGRRRRTGNEKRADLIFYLLFSFMYNRRTHSMYAQPSDRGKAKMLTRMHVSIHANMSHCESNYFLVSSPLNQIHRIAYSVGEGTGQKRGASRVLLGAIPLMGGCMYLSRCINNAKGTRFIRALNHDEQQNMTFHVSTTPPTPLAPHHSICPPASPPKPTQAH